MRQHSWDAALLGAVTLIAALNGVLADQKVMALTPQTNSVIARSDASQPPVTITPAHRTDAGR